MGGPPGRTWRSRFRDRLRTSAKSSTLLLLLQPGWVRGKTKWSCFSFLFSFFLFCIFLCLGRYPGVVGFCGFLRGLSFVLHLRGRHLYDPHLHVVPVLLFSFFYNPFGGEMKCFPRKNNDLLRFLVEIV